MKKSTLALTATLIFGASIAHAYPRHDPNTYDNGNLWEVTAYLDTSDEHAQLATQRLCFLPYAAPGAGNTNISGTWYSTSFPNWSGHYQQEGDQVIMTGNYAEGDGNDGMIWDIVTTTKDTIGAGHWMEFRDTGANGRLVGIANALFKRVGECHTPSAGKGEIQLPDIKPRLLKDGRIAEFPNQRGQVDLEGASELEKLFD